MGRYNLSFLTTYSNSFCFFDYWVHIPSEKEEHDTGQVFFQFWSFLSSVHWLTLYVNLTEPSECQDIWLNTIFSVSLFLYEISIWLGTLSKAECPPLPLMWVGLIQSKTWTGEKGYSLSKRFLPAWFAFELGHCFSPKN